MCVCIYHEKTYGFRLKHVKTHGFPVDFSLPIHWWRPPCRDLRSIALRLWQLPNCRTWTCPGVLRMVGEPGETPKTMALGVWKCRIWRFFPSPKSMVLASENGRVWKSCQELACFPPRYCHVNRENCCHLKFMAVFCWYTGFRGTQRSGKSMWDETPSASQDLNLTIHQIPELQSLHMFQPENFRFRFQVVWLYWKFIGTRGWKSGWLDMTSPGVRGWSIFRPIRPEEIPIQVVQIHFWNSTFVYPN